MERRYFKYDNSSFILTLAKKLLFHMKTIIEVNVCIKLTNKVVQNKIQVFTQIFS